MFTDLGDALLWCEDAEQAGPNMESTGDTTAHEERIVDEQMPTSAEVPVVSERRASLTLGTTLIDRYQAIVKIQMDDTEDSLSQILHIWRTYRERVASTSSTDYLSLDHIGLFLRRLREKVHCEPVIRTIPQCLASDKPNFVLCPERSVFQLVLSLYMSLQHDAPLPLPSEVLLCTRSTTTEEVELIWARAFTESPSGDRKLYSILWIDKLRMETTQELEKRLQAMAAQQRTLQHPLLIVSIADSQENAYLMSSFDFNIIDFHNLHPFISEPVRIQKWLKQKLHSTDPTVSASSVDPELCCVRLVTSEQSGMGKSVFVQRRVEQLLTNLSRHTSFQNARLANDTLSVTISLHQKLVETEYLMEQLFRWRATSPIDEQQRAPAVIHLDVSREVREGLDRVLFSLLILGALRRRDGFVWLRHPRDLYIIENTPLLKRVIASRM